MAVTKLFYLHGVNTPTQFYTAIQGGSLAVGTVVRTTYPAGHFETFGRFVETQNPVAQWTTLDLAQALNDLGVAGLGITSAVDLYEHQADNLANRKAGSTHNKYTVNESFQYIQSISAPHGGPATAQVRLMCNYDTTNEPVIPAGSQALAGTPVVGQHYTAGPVTINGTLLPGVQQIDIDFGIALVIAGGEGEIWNTFFAVATITPQVRVRVMDTSLFTTFGLDGTALSGSGVEAYLRQKSPDGANYPDLDTPDRHIKFTGATGIVYPDPLTLGGTTPNTVDLVCDLRAPDTTTRALVVDTTSDIT